MRAGGPKSSRKLLWLAVPAALLALLALVAARGSSTSPADSAAQPTADAAGREASAASQGKAAARAAATSAKPATAAEVRRAVEEKNRGPAADQRAFAAAGWKMVEVAPPDLRLSKADPALLAGREDELRTQIASTTATPDQADNLAEIARRASEDSTRVAAVEALGRLGPAGQQNLLGLLDGLPEGDRARREVVPLLRPESLDSALAKDLAARLDSRGPSAIEKKQLAFTLALLGLRDQSALPDPVRGALSQDALALIDSMDRLARQATDNPETQPTEKNP